MEISVIKDSSVNRGDSTLTIYGCGSKINLEPGKSLFEL
jgi:hypothetical protein